MEEPPEFAVILEEEMQKDAVFREVRVHVLLTDETIDLVVQGEDPTVGDVKDTFEERFGLSIHRQVLFKDRPVRDEEAVSAHLHGRNDSFRLIVKRGLTVAVTWRIGNGDRMLCVMDIEGNTTATQGHVAGFIDQVLRVPKHVQDFRIGGVPWNNESEPIQGFQPLNVLPLTLLTRPHILVDATMVFAPRYTPKRILRFGFNKSMSVGEMRKNVTEWLMTFEDFNGTLDLDMDPADYTWRFFFRGKLCDESNDNQTLEEVGLVPFEKILPHIVEHYSLDMQLVVMRQRAAEPRFNMSMRTAMRKELVNITGLTPSDNVAVAGVLFAQSILRDIMDTDGPAPSFIFKRMRMELNRSFSDYGVYNGCVVDVSMPILTGGFVGSGTRDEKLEDDDYGDY